MLAAAFAGLSLGTRSIGIVMIPVILWDMAQRSGLPWARLLPRMALCGLLAASGLLIYAAYLGLKFGHPLAFATSQAAWHSGTFPDRLVSALTLATLRDLNLWTAGWFLCFLALSIWSFWRLRTTVALYGLGLLAVPYLTLGLTDSMTCYELVCFPAFICMGSLGVGRPWLVIALIGIFAALLLQTAALFSQWHWVALTHRSCEAPPAALVSPYHAATLVVRIGRHPRGEFVEPGDKPRMVRTPFALETQVAIAEHAGNRDLPDIGQRFRIASNSGGAASSALRPRATLPT